MTDYEMTLRGFRRELMPRGQPDLQRIELGTYDRLFVAPNPTGVRELARPPAQPRPLTYVLEPPGTFSLPDALGVKVLVGAGVTAKLGRADVQALRGVLDITECWGTMEGGRATVRNCKQFTALGGDVEVIDDPAGQPSRLVVGERINFKALAGRGQVELKGEGNGPQRLELGDHWRVTLHPGSASLQAAVLLRDQACGHFDLVAIPTHRLALEMQDKAVADVHVAGGAASGSSSFSARVFGGSLVVDARSVQPEDGPALIEVGGNGRVDAGSRCVVRALGGHVVARGSCKVYRGESATVEEIGDNVQIRELPRATIPA